MFGFQVRGSKLSVGGFGFRVCHLGEFRGIWVEPRDSRVGLKPRRQKAWKPHAFSASEP